MAKARILVIAHAHPDFSHGGGEIAAYSLFRGYLDSQAVEDAFFLARVPGQSGVIANYKEREYVWEQYFHDDFYMEGMNVPIKIEMFRAFLEAVRPTVVHVQHLINIGYDLLEVIKRFDPNIKIYFTLHEYMPICRHCGQMMRPNRELCDHESLENCRICFPEVTEGEFWQRKRRLLHWLSHVDAFITPSNFLQNRYIDWGIEPERIFTIENGLRQFAPCPPRNPVPGEGRNRFGFFGTINQFKGLHVLFQALERLSSEQRRTILVEINGANFEIQPEDFKKEISSYRKKFEAEGILKWNGPYEADQLPQRMRNIDWVVVPSIWWENSPVVIQEAFALGRPLLVSDIGGMKEKVKNNINGLHVQARNPVAWAEALMRAKSENGLWDRLRENIPEPMSRERSTEEHLKLMGLIN